MEEFWLWLVNIPGMFRQKISGILEVFHTPEELFRANEKLLRLSGVLKQEDIHNIMQSRKEYSYEREWDKLCRLDTRFYSFEHEHYPKRLKTLYDYPYGVFVRGKGLPSDKSPVVAMVGARNCSRYGAEIAACFAKVFGENGICVISGLAKGIDVHSHRGALMAGAVTCGVLGSGVDICYPAENADVFEKIQEHGALISEYPIGARPAPWKFPARNRIISGLADGVLVVEARKKSGSLITVECALEQGKDVYAVPGRIGDVLSEGCNRLIQSGAIPALSPKDVLGTLSCEKFQDYKFWEKREYPLAKDLEVVYSCVDLFPKNVQTIMEEVGENSPMVLEKLLQLQMMNLIQEPVKGYYLRKLS